MSASSRTRRTTSPLLPLDCPGHSRGRDGCFFSHAQTPSGICSCSESTDTMCSNASTTLWLTSSVYETAKTASAHLATTLPSYFSAFQATWGDRSVVIQSNGRFCVLDSLMRNGSARFHMILSQSKATAARNNTSTIPCSPLHPKRSTYGKSALIALCLE